MRACRWMLIAALLTAAVAAHGQPRADYAREERWAQEIVPSLMTGDAVYLRTPSRARVLALETRPSGPAKGTVILVHGLGVHPDFGMIGGLRALIADAGYTTLAVQMPVLAVDATRTPDATRADYAVTFPEAVERLVAAVAHARASGAMRVAIVSHSMGASMTDAYLARRPAPPVDAVVPIGMLVPWSAPPYAPVLDLIAERDLAAVLAAAPSRKDALPRDRCSAQLVVSGTEHYFEGAEKVLAGHIVRFLDRVLAGGC